MRDSLAHILSYLFMSAAVTCVISAFGVIIIFLRSMFGNISQTEKDTGFLFVYIFIACIILAPIFLYASNKLEKYSGRMDEI